uniref:Uncharacterized protein n=1 Tax=Quercus lobata TaxID=97700 RepID=A0A7N2M027_QUELO
MVSLLKVNHQQHFAVFSSGIRPNNKTFHRKSSFISMSSRSSTTIQHLHNTVSPSSNHSLNIPIMAGHKYCLLGKLSSEVGWNHNDTIKIVKRKGITSSCEQSK